MIALHLLQYLKEQGFGTAIDTDLFFENMPLGKTGVAVYSRGGDSSPQHRLSSFRFDLYCRGSSNLTGYNNLENIKNHFQDNYDTICELPIVPSLSNRIYKNCRVTVMNNIENLGIDENDRVIYRLGAEITYEKEEN